MFSIYALRAVQDSDETTLHGTISIFPVMLRARAGNAWHPMNDTHVPRVLCNDLIMRYTTQLQLQQ